MNFRFASKLAIMCLILGLFLAPGSLYAADLEITEVMYNPEGLDADHEWLEIHNTSGSGIDLSEWKFREGGSNHIIKSVDAGLFLPAGERAVITRDPDAFANRYSISALIITGSFGSGLHNDEESLGLVNSDGDVVDIVTYKSTYGADGDGDSLQRAGSSWIAASPTPGKENKSASNQSSADNDDNDSSTSRNTDWNFISSRTAGADKESGESISITAGRDINGWVGIPVELKGAVEGAGDPSDFTAQWSLGNGDTRAGLSTSYTYGYPGKYLATFSVTADDETLSDQLVVDIRAIKLALEAESGSDGYVKIHNETPRRFDLSGWRLVSGGEEFVLPEYSAALAHGELIVPHRVSGFFAASASLYQPDGSLATSTQREAPTVSYAGGYESSRAGERTTVIQTAYAESDGEGESNTTKATTSSATSAGLILGTSSAAASTGQLSVFAQWGGLLMALLLAAIGTIILMRRVSKPASDAGVQATKFDIEE
ncbi:MAG: lamin tail domain-containing protein, partial [Candidatus Paceibacterota bacterium]